MSLAVGTGDLVVLEDDPYEEPGEVITVVSPSTVRVRWYSGESEEPVADLVVVRAAGGAA